MMRRLAIHCMLAAVVAFGAVGLGGCDQTTQNGLLGYHAEELFPEQYQTVAVDIFDNRTFFQGVEFDLTEALVKEIELRTPYKVVANDRADTVITGTIHTVRQQSLSRVRNGGVPQEMQLIVRVNYEWKDVREGRVIRKRRTLSGSGEYIPSSGLSEPYEVAQHRAVAEIARDLVSDMRRDW
jgi:hypothetical protein